MLYIGNYLFNEKNIYFDNNKYSLFLADNSNLDGNEFKYDINNIKKNSMVLYEVNPIDYREEKLWYGLLVVGDILVLDINDKMVLKRITQIKKEENGYSIILANDVDVLYEKSLILSTYESKTIIGKVKSENRFIGQFLSKLKRIDDTLIFYIMPLMCIAIMEVYLYRKTKEKNEKS